MDFLNRPTVAEDAVQYRLFLLHSDPLDVEEKNRFLEGVLAEVAALMVGYIWQKQPFNLSFHPEK
ncbi:protein ecdysoneless homolog isoform X1, partial [Tachysurus ichikawai]